MVQQNKHKVGEKKQKSSNYRPKRRGRGCHRATEDRKIVTKSVGVITARIPNGTEKIVDIWIAKIWRSEIFIAARTNEIRKKKKNCVETTPLSKF